MGRKARGRSITDGNSTYDLAARLAGLRGKGYSTRQIMDETGLAISTINNRLRVFDTLEPSLLRKYAAGRLSTMEAERLARFKSHARQWKEYERGQPQGRRLRISDTRSLLDACSRSSRSAEWKRGAVDALRCALGEATIEGVWPRE